MIGWLDKRVSILLRPLFLPFDAMSSLRSIPTVDRISSLPDLLLCHVLSFLPTKLAVTTSILSKRWKPLWQSLLSLDFHDEGFTDFNTFRHFVYSVIVSRDSMLPIRSFRIKCGVSDNFDPRDLNRFIHAALQRGLQNFDLELLDAGFYYNLLKFTPSLLRVLNCKTLVVLKLTYFSLSDIPLLVDLPLLKTLHLESIVFGIDFLHFKNLVSGCPILENFYINDVILPDIYNDSLAEFKGFPKLVRAKLFYSEENFPFAWLHNVKFLRVELTSPYEYPVPTFHNLTHIELIFDSEAWPEKWKWVIQVLQHCPKLQSLTIDKDFKNGRVIEEEDWKDPEIVPECLSSRLRTCSLRGFKGNLCELQFAEYIMLNSKLLCTMAIKSICGVDGIAKHQMLVKLSSYPRGSVTCKLLYD